MRVLSEEEEVGIPKINFSYGINSYVIPPRAAAARRGYAEGCISRTDLVASEDSAVLDLVAKQKRAGLGVICDGNLRWNNCLSFMTGLGGLRECIAPPGKYFTGQLLSAKTVVLDAPVSGEHHPVVDDFRILRTQVEPGIVAKQMLPAPSTVLDEINLGGSRKNHSYMYTSNDELVQNIAEAYQRILDDLYTMGCRYVQFDDCSWNRLSDTEHWPELGYSAQSVRTLCDQYAFLNRLAISKIPHDMAVVWRIKREDFHTTARYTGTYNSVAPWIISQENACAYSVPVDISTGTGLDVLEYIPSGMRVILEVATSRDETYMDIPAVGRCVDIASKYVPRELVGIALGFEHNVVDPGKPHACHCCSQDELDDMPERLEQSQWEKVYELAQIALWVCDPVCGR